MKLMDARRANVLSQEAREAYARSLFKPETIAGEIERAISVGKTEIRVFQTIPVDLSATDAASALNELLTDLGYSLVWEESAQKEEYGKRETTRVFRYRELLLKWEI